MDRLARHQTSVQHEHDHDGVDFERSPGEPHAAGDGLVDPAAVHPVRHHGVEPEGRRYGRALKVLGLASRVLGDGGRGHVEACETGEAAQHEEGQTHVVEGRAYADGEGNNGGGQAEGDLWHISKVCGLVIVECGGERGSVVCVGGESGHTKSARLSSSCPIILLFLRHRATLPSMKSKNRPKGRKARAA